MMKKFYFIQIALLNSFFLFGQTPNAFNYQAVLRDASGNVRSNASITMLIGISEGLAGSSVYEESFAVTTNVFGLVNIQIGKGTVISGTFSSISWGTNTYFMKVSVDGAEMGTSQLLSVPYALYAGSGDYNNLLNKPVYNDSYLRNFWTDLHSFDNNTTGEYNIALGYFTLNHNSEGKYNVAIGKNALLNNTTGNDNVAIGENTLLYNTTGFDNIVIGKKTMAENVGGWNNTALGAFALGSNISGNDNIAIGSDALRSNTTANNNIGIGNKSLNDNISGEDNIAIGPYSLTHNTSGQKNIAIGRDALNTNTTGNFNIALGESSLFSNISGKWNVAMGYAALSKDKYGDKLTAIGYEALKQCTGWDNTAVGYQSLLTNTEGFDNVALGVNALDANTTGDGNTAVGKNAMHAQVTGNNNTAIGFNSNISEGVFNSTAIGYDASATANNKIVIGNISVTSIGGFAPWTNYSDERLKDNISYNNRLGLNFITKLRTANYYYKTDVSKHNRDGLIAQDVQKALKELGLSFSGLVIDDNKEQTMNLSYSEFVLPLINAVQELNLKNQKLEQKNDALEALLNQMNAKIEKLEQLSKNK